MSLTPPVIIIGAPRSGTNMLRDLLTSVPGYGTWPCDEINYIWRHGNLRHPHDRFTTEMATPQVAGYITTKFADLARRANIGTVVEKTCANSLRVGFIDAIFPDARFVFIARDGVDAAASAMQRWQAKAEFRYLAKKSRWVPPSDLPYYGIRFVRNRIHKLRSQEGRLAYWGPAIEGMQDLLATRPLAEVCALQWAGCVSTALADLGDLDPSRVLSIRYEDLVRHPDVGLKSLATFLDFEPPHLDDMPAFRDITAAMIGKGRRSLDAASLAAVEPIVDPVLDRLDRELGR